MDISALESMANSLERSLDRWSWWLSAATILVVIGLVLEYWPDLIKLMKSKPFDWLLLRTMIGGAFITIGVAGELIAQSLASGDETKLRSASHEIEGALSQKAADADEHSRELEVQVADAKKEIARLSAVAERARADVADAIARAKEAERGSNEAKLALEKFRAWRVMTFDQQAEIVKAIAQFKGTRFDISLITGDPEATNFLGVIAFTLQLAQWEWIEYAHPTGPFMSVYNFPGKPNIGQQGSGIGIAVLVHQDHTSELSAAANALSNALAEVNGSAIAVVDAPADIPNHDTIHIMIGKKPQ
jgi:hypothetical protein